MESLFFAPGLMNLADVEHPPPCYTAKYSFFIRARLPSPSPRITRRPSVLSLYGQDTFEEMLSAMIGHGTH